METIKDIVAELRKHNGATLPPWVIFNEDGGLDVTLFVDRIEAAHKREVEDAIASTVKAAAKSASEVYEPHIQSAPVGNAAKTREELEEIREFAAAMDVDEPNVLAILDACRDALSAPVRNCDRFTNAQDAIDAWNCMSLMEQGDFEYITQWLFAEAEGETK